MNEKDKDVVDGIISDINKLLDGMDDISQLLVMWDKINGAKKQFEDINERLKVKVKTYLKERQWKRYDDEKTKISVSISSVKKEIVDKQQLKLMLTEAQLAQVIHISSHERMVIMTPQMRRRLKNYVKQPKHFSKS